MQYLIIKVLTIYNRLTNDIVSFEQLDPDAIMTVDSEVKLKLKQTIIFGKKHLNFLLYLF